MADDERRAEIEAVQRVLEDADLHLHMRMDSMELKGAPAEEVAEDVLAALDRVRDARGEDHEKCGHGACVRPKGHTGSHSVHLEGTPFAVPQGEDHEAVEAALDAIEGYAQALTDQRGWGATRRAICENAQKVRTYLSHVSPSRDGTVAVEQPEPDALGGLPPSQPKEDQR